MRHAYPRKTHLRKHSSLEREMSSNGMKADWADFADFATARSYLVGLGGPISSEPSVGLGAEEAVEVLAPAADVVALFVAAT